MVHLTSFRALVLVTTFIAACGAQDAPTPALTDEPRSTATPQLTATIATLDSTLFAAFNAHDAEAMEAYFTLDLEFYHDKTGLAGFDTTMANFRDLFEQNSDTGLRRDLVPGTLEVHPLGEFGALAICQHRFCHVEDGEDDCGTFKNIMVWRRDSTGWKVCRVISYDH